MFKFASAFLLCGLLVSTLTSADQNSLVDVRSDEEALQGACIEEDCAEIGQPLKRVKKVPTAKPVQRVLATDEELRSITKQIWEADINRLSTSDVVYNVEAWKSGGKFFTTVNADRLGVGTYARMIALFNCYNDLTGMSCRDIEKEFHKAILDTPPINAAREWVEKRDKNFRFNNRLLQYWFTRTGKYTENSGFKHTFVGGFGKDEKTGQDVVKGLHNWVRMFLEEKEERLVYKSLRHSCPPFIETIAFNWTPIKTTQSYHKSFSSAFIRTSPEVEIALYTICVLTRKNEDCPIQLQLNGIPLKIFVSAQTVLDQDTIISAYPICNPLDV